MSQLSAGKEVLSFCNKCKLTLAHTIVTMKDTNTIGRVECKTCKGTHAYKDPSTVGASKTKTGKASKKTGRKSTKESISDLWLTAVNSSKAKSQAYSPRTTFEVDDIIDHSKFGPGVVQRRIDSDKIEVIFRHEIKILVHNK